MNVVTGAWTQGWEVAVKATLMYATALVALRLGERRTLAQWTIIDFATAVAMGAIIGRTAVASQQSWVIGAIAVVTLVVVHRVVSILRFTNAVAELVDHRVRVVVDHGRIRGDELRRCAITEADLYAHLRQQGVFDLATVRYVLYEAKGNITVVPEPRDGRSDPPLVEAGIRSAANYP